MNVSASTPATQTTTKDLSFCSGPLVLFFPCVAGKSVRRVMAVETDGISRRYASNEYVCVGRSLSHSHAHAHTQPDATRSWSGEINGTHAVADDDKDGDERLDTFESYINDRSLG